MKKKLNFLDTSVTITALLFPEILTFLDSDNIFFIVSRHCFAHVVFQKKLCEKFTHILSNSSITLQL